MRISTTITLKRHVGALTVSDCEREWDVDGVDVEERVQVVGRIVVVEGEEQAVADSVDGMPRAELSERERDRADEALWFSYERDSREEAR